MNNPENAPADVAQERAWLIGHKQQLGLGWDGLGRKVGIPGGTIGPFCNDKYKGDNQKIANQVYRYRQLLESQAQIETEAPDIPLFAELPTSKRLLGLLKWAHRGRIIAAAMGPGTSKTFTIDHYCDSVVNAVKVTMAPSTAGVNNMQIEVLEALGEPDAAGTSQKLSRRIMDKVRNSQTLIVFDEAQHLSEKSVEEIRSWHDAVGVGVALMGNHDVIGRLEGGSRKAAYAQLYSRVSMRINQMLPGEADARMLAEAWGMYDEKLVGFLCTVAAKPGGLRNLTMVAELATMIARTEQRDVKLDDLQDAWLQLSSRPRAA